MVPTDFDGSNLVLDKPADMDRDECNPLCVQRGILQPEQFPVVVSCWKFTQEELAEVNRTGRIYLSVLGFTMPPVILSGLPLEVTPFES